MNTSSKNKQSVANSLLVGIVAIIFGWLGGACHWATAGSLALGSRDCEPKSGLADRNKAAATSPSLGSVGSITGKIVVDQAQKSQVKLILLPSAIPAKFAAEVLDRQASAYEGFTRDLALHIEKNEASIKKYRARGDDAFAQTVESADKRWRSILNEMRADAALMREPLQKDGKGMVAMQDVYARVRKASRFDSKVVFAIVADEWSKEDDSFEISNLKPGDYFLFAEVNHPKGRFAWFLPVTVRDGGERVNLTTVNGSLFIHP